MFKFNDILQILAFFALLTLLSPLIGWYINLVFNRESRLPAFLTKIENYLIGFFKIDATAEMDWKTYCFSVLIFNFIGIVFLVLIQAFQQYLPLNPQKLPNVEIFLAINTAISFVTNTNWQSYAGETTLSYFVQMIGLTVQNFVSAATGIAVLFALTRGIVTRQGKSLGNFWNDLVKSVLYVLLPIAILFSVVIIGQGVVQTFTSYADVTTLEGAKQTIPLGPAASQIAIKQIGTNGGGFFNANSAFPFENPTPLTNFLYVLFLILIPSGLIFTYGKMVKSSKHAWMIYCVMLFLLAFGFFVSYASECSTNNVFHASGLMEGKETRFGVMNSVLYSTTTTAASNGSVNAMHSSLSPMAGFVAMTNMMLGEIIFGGVGSGLYGMIIFIILTVFIAGLMIGRTPEYLGKKIESFEVKWSILAVLAPSFVILVFSSIALITKSGTSSMLNSGPHGFSEVLYTFASAAGNNGSAFAGLNANTAFYNIMIGLGMLIGRYGVIVPILAIAGSLVKKKITPLSAGSLTTDNFIFSVLLFGIIIIVGALTFFPALSLGPLIEQLLMNSGVSF